MLPIPYWSGVHSASPVSLQLLQKAHDVVLPTHSHSSPSAMSTLPFPHACVAWQRPFANEFNVSMHRTLTREDEWRKMHQVEYRHSYSRVYLLTAGAFKQAKSPSTSPQTERLSAASLQIVPSGSQATLRWLKLQFSKSRHSLGCGNGGGGAREQRKQALAPPPKKKEAARPESSEEINKRAA